MSSSTVKSSLAFLALAGLLAAAGCSQQQKTEDGTAAPEAKEESTGWFQQKKQNKDEAAAEPKKEEESSGWFQQKKQNKPEEANEGSSQQKKDAPAPAAAEPAAPATPATAPAAPAPAAAPSAPAAPAAPAPAAAPTALPKLGTGVQAASDTARVGEADEFGYIAQNMGNVELTNVVLVVDFGAAFEYKGTDFPGTVARDGSKVTFTLGTLGVGKSVTLKFTADCKAAGPQEVKTVTSSSQTTSVPNDEKVTISQ